MAPAEARVDEGGSSPLTGDVDVLVVGAGVTGIYQLYRAREAGFSVALIEAGDGVGGTWYWNRYPESRFDSESYTYGYIFSRELFEGWVWDEHYAAQPETERYFNHVVDTFDLRRHIHFGARVTSAVFDEPSGTWTVRASDGSEVRARYLVAATGGLSVPYVPDVPGRETFAGEAYHTGRWPKTPVDFAGKRVAVVGTGSSGVQVIPAIVDEVASMTVYQRSANWCTPLNNGPITPDEQEQLREQFERMVRILKRTESGFLHREHDRATFDDEAEERQAFFEKMWTSPGFSKLISNYTDMMFDPAANAEWCDFIRSKIRSIVEDPETAERLIPTDHPFGGKRPPFVTGYYEAFNKPHVSLVDLRATPMVRITPAGIETSDGLEEFDIIVWATGFDYGTGALNRMGVRGRDGLALEDHWADGPQTYLGICCAGFPNLFFPGGPHGAAGNNPRYSGDQVDFVSGAIVFARDHGYDVVEAEPAAEDEWTAMIDTYAKDAPFKEVSYFYGTNIPGKPRRYLLNAAGRTKFLQLIADVVEHDYPTLAMSRSPAPTSA
jgi:cation diffusion facilitator CzcD-associated flavoprotein CzcO